MTLYQTFSRDGGLTWSFPESVYASSAVHLCEPGCVRSPDGKQLAVLLRENARRRNSHVIFSNDEGKTWTGPREVPLALTGDRHTGKYGPDGRLFISFRCRSPRHRAEGRPFEGDWVAWVGSWEDIAKGRDGQYSVRLKDNTKGYDTSYPGVELLPDGTLVMTYGQRLDLVEGCLVSYRWGCGALLSHDNGLTWDLAHETLINSFDHGDGSPMGYSVGHTYSTLLDDGAVLTCYGYLRTKGMCLVKWQPTGGTA